jgi:hypothetical protein
MYFDHINTARSSWKYTYFGKDLYEKASALVRRFTDEEQAAREKIAALLKDSSIPIDDPKNEEAKREVERVARLHEECRVYRHEFERHPDREYNLSLGDVVFFDFPQSESK